jgi:shikimate 5-dehydrogenase
LPIDLASMPRESVVVDLVFSNSATPLSAAARRCGHRVIDGRDILVVQAARQYRLMIGQEMPRMLARDLLGLEKSPERTDTRRGRNCASRNRSANC